MYLLHDYAFSFASLFMCPDHQIFAQRSLGMALQTLRNWSVFDFPWLVFFPLSIFMVIKTAAVDLRSALMSFAVWRTQKEERYASSALNSWPHGASPQRSQEEGKGDHINSRDSPRTCAEIKAAKNSL